jgi:hypothetical protein
VGVWVCSFTSAVCVCVVPVCGFLAMVLLLFWPLTARLYSNPFCCISFASLLVLGRV